MVLRPSQMSGSGRRPSRRCEIGRETFLEVRKWTGVPPGGPEVVGDPPGGSELFGDLPEVRKWSGDPPGDPEVVGRPSRGPEVVVDHSGSMELVGRPSRRSGTGWETLLKVQKWSETILEVWNWS